jgi:class 3 adenylate cyclase
MVTPFKADESLDLLAFVANTRAHLAAGLSGVLVAGSTGEAPLLGDDERRTLIEAARKVVPSDRTLLAGTGAEATAHCVARCRDAASSGADAVLVVPPHYYASARVLRPEGEPMNTATPLPTGTVTFLLTDIEGSTRLWEQHPEAMRDALARHHALLTYPIEQHHGIVVKRQGEGDSLFAVFARASDALAAAIALQQALHAEPWPPETPLRVRVALHTGPAELRDGDYFGPAVNRCARLRAGARPPR